jgi:hypothetical protein
MAKSSEYGRFAVEGGGEFPLDMLRYDAAYPASESDSYRMRERGKRVVWLETKRERITPARWASFCWKVLNRAEEEAALEARRAASPFASAF